MKKVVFSVMVIIVTMSVLYVKFCSTHFEVSNLTLANVEALSISESSSNYCERYCESWPTTYCVLETPISYKFCIDKFPK